MKKTTFVFVSSGKVTCALIINDNFSPVAPTASDLLQWEVKVQGPFAYALQQTMRARGFLPWVSGDFETEEGSARFAMPLTRRTLTVEDVAIALEAAGGLNAFEAFIEAQSAVEALEEAKLLLEESLKANQERPWLKHFHSRRLRSSLAVWARGE